MVESMSSKKLFRFEILVEQGSISSHNNFAVNSINRIEVLKTIKVLVYIKKFLLFIRFRNNLISYLHTYQTTYLYQLHQL